MKTISFIGSDKNAGKTTAMNFFLKGLGTTILPQNICLTSIGINGERIDQYEGKNKPRIKIPKNFHFITSENNFSPIAGRAQIIDHFPKYYFKKNYILAKANTDLIVILEGPNDKNSLIKMKEEIQNRFELLILDGSIDRQFLGVPQITDGMFFSLLITNRNEQMNKARALMTPLYLRVVSEIFRNKIINEGYEPYKIVLFDQHWQSIFASDESALLCDQYISILDANTDKEFTLYLNCSLNRSLGDKLARYSNLTIILNNLTLFQNVSTDIAAPFLPELELLHSVNLLGIFLKEETLNNPFLPLPNTPYYNLFREVPDEIRIS